MKRDADHNRTSARYFAWAALLLRIFATDVLACEECGGRLRLVSTLEHPPIVGKILKHLGLPLEPPPPSAARAPEWLPGVRAADYEDQSPAGRAD